MPKKTKPIQTDYLTEDCRGPSGLAMTPHGALAQNTKLKKQSQFVQCTMDVKAYIIVSYINLIADRAKKAKPIRTNLEREQLIIDRAAGDG